MLKSLILITASFKVSNFYLRRTWAMSFSCLADHSVLNLSTSTTHPSWLWRTKKLSHILWIAHSQLIWWEQYSRDIDQDGFCRPGDCDACCVYGLQLFNWFEFGRRLSKMEVIKVAAVKRHSGMLVCNKFPIPFTAMTDLWILVADARVSSCCLASLSIILVSFTVRFDFLLFPSGFVGVYVWSIFTTPCVAAVVFSWFRLIDADGEHVSSMFFALFFSLSSWFSLFSRPVITLSFVFSQPECFDSLSFLCGFVGLLVCRFDLFFLTFSFSPMHPHPHPRVLALILTVASSSSSISLFLSVKHHPVSTILLPFLTFASSS